MKGFLTVCFLFTLIAGPSALTGNINTGVETFGNPPVNVGS